MCATFADDDVEKPVERADGRVIGTVAAIEEGRARVDPAPDAIDSIKARLGWAEVGDPFTLEADAVDAITDTRVHLEDGFSTESTAAESPADTPETPPDNTRNPTDR
ncbi:hypothetical protein [Haloterrigena alkaliphila]|uniref:hypothetical protein n=1 Tax=Haloterrigena alkaliphila TaxID=2816475 RepID=UPI001CECE11A|nr:hypothetical protein [Haloterrigena alkaliphila]UHQ95034.1 hypothetical protein J0X25_03720 [Haloterrigena alkaliphila]